MPAIDTPARIAVLGAGPIGVEAALYARFLGYEVDLYERGRVGENLLGFGHVRLFSPFGMNRSPLGLAALEAQDSAWRAPADDALLTAREHVEAYLRPLAETDLLADCVHERTRVVAIARDGTLKRDLIGDPRRAEFPFRLLLEDAQGRQSTATAEAVIDASGTYGNPTALGPGGLPLPGQSRFAAKVEPGLPDILGAERERYAGKRTLVVGAGYSAATNVVALATLAQEADKTEVQWVTRRRTGEPSGDDRDPIPRIPDDPLPERERLAQRANELAATSPHVSHRPGSWIESIDESATGLRVRLAGESPTELEVDSAIANVGFRPDTSVYSELQVHTCYATDGPMKLAAALLGETSADCLDQKSHGPAALENPEPNFYILGAKSYGRNSRFLISLGLEQIRDVFSTIVGRAELDLYKTIRPVAQSPGGD